MATLNEHAHKYDVVIVGAGGAGMRAALESGQRARTAVLTKLYPTRSHTGAAQGGMCAALANVEEDNWEWHTFDTVKGGDYLVDQDAAEVMCKEAIDAVLDLEKMGLPFNRTPEGRIDQRRFGGHTRNHGEAAVRRSCYAADRTGHMILQTLYQNCVKHGVEFYNEFYVLDLLLTEVDRRDVRTAGVVAYELATGELHVFQAKSVVFATGGFGKVFKTTSNAHTLTGDGMGDRLPQGPAAGGHGVLPVPPDRPGRPRHPAHRGRPRRGRHPAQRRRRALHGALRAHHQGPRAARHGRPGDGHRGPRGPRRGPGQGLRAPRPDPPAGRADRRQAAGHHRVRPHLPRRRAATPSRSRSSRPRTTRWAASRPTSTPEVLRDNDHVVPGLYAAGEVACVSVHGANRLGTNSLLDINVFGRRAGIAAAEYATKTDCVDLPATPAADTREAGRAAARRRPATERVATIRRELQETMDLNAQVYRTEATLKQA